MTANIQKYLRTKDTFCTGCGNRVVMNILISAIDRLYGSMDGFVFVSGIGCAGWIPNPNIKADAVHTTHGRPIPFAAGVKLANPDLRVVVVSGDGDLAAIGGNHLVHAARRNLEITTICVNNLIYGMTGGQTSPTTPENALTSTAPCGNIEYPFDLAPFVASAGAPYSARWTTYHVKELEAAMGKAIQKGKKGFAFLEVLSQCPTQFARRNPEFTGKMHMAAWFREHSISVSEASKLGPGERDGRILVGEFADSEREGFVKRLRSCK